VRMISKSFLPFGGVHGWLADLTVSRRVGAAKAGFVKKVFVVESYYVAEPDERRAMTAIRAHAEAGQGRPSSPGGRCHAMRSVALG
jgi:hypothetical protein